MARIKRQPGDEPPVPATVRPAYDAIVGRTDAFCREHLTEEYEVLCRKLAGVLARKRPSPLPSGKPETWACGIVRTIGWVNFLDDSTQPLHMKLTEIDRAMGVSSGTGQAKSKAIRDLLKVRPLDPEWTLPSRIDSNPVAWMIQVNGLIVDARMMPREVQEEAFARGMIPYLPAEGKDGAADEGDDPRR